VNLPPVKLEDYDYQLPKDRIALYPLPVRSESRLLAADARNGAIAHLHFNDITGLLPSDSLLILNSTKVIAARLPFRKPTGGSAEILCVEPVHPSSDPQLVMAEKEACSWKCIIGGRKILEGMTLVPDSREDMSGLRATIRQRTGNEAIVDFAWKDAGPFVNILEYYGITPLPPYIKREAENTDKTTYQTVYADKEGSVAAPTAGLHFTPEVLQSLKNKGITVSELILHVGPGTFQPIETDLQSHIMHSEMFITGRDFLERIIVNSGKKIVCTGTTSLRTMETLYWLGVKALHGTLSPSDVYLTQYEPYEFLGSQAELPGLEASFTELRNFMDVNGLTKLTGRTQLFIVPGYTFHTADALITNFHMPKSTLILLVAAFIGKDLWQRAYTEAISDKYRFLSYGDSSLLIRSL